MITALTMAFLATLGFAACQLYRNNRLTVDTLPDDQRAVLLGSVGVLALMIAGAGPHARRRRASERCSG